MSKTCEGCQQRIDSTATTCPFCGRVHRAAKEYEEAHRFVQQQAMQRAEDAMQRDLVAYRQQRETLKAEGVCIHCNPPGSGKCSECKDGKKLKEVDEKFTDNPVSWFAKAIGADTSSTTVEIECQHCHSTGKCQHCGGTGRGDDQRYFIVKDEQRYEISWLQAKQFQRGEAIQHEGESLRASTGDLIGREFPQGVQYVSVQNDQGVVITQSAVDAGITVLKLAPKRDHMDTIVGVSGRLTATKRALRPGDLEYQLIGVSPDRGTLATGTLDLPNAQIGETVRFRIKDKEAFSIGKVVIRIGVKPSREEGENEPSQDEYEEVGEAGQWYCAKGKQRLGPFTTEQLRQLTTAGAIQPTDMVLKAGAQQWVQASTVSELAFPASGPSVPPPPPPPARWYYARDGKAVGPVVMEDLRRLVASGQLQPADFLLQEGTQTWVPVNTIPSLTSIQ